MTVFLQYILNALSTERPGSVSSISTNAFAERLLRMVRGECLDKLLIINKEHLLRVMKEYISHYNRYHPHQGIDQAVPDGNRDSDNDGDIISLPVLGGLHHDYQRKAA